MTDNLRKTQKTKRTASKTKLNLPFAKIRSLNKGFRSLDPKGSVKIRKPIPLKKSNPL